MSHFRLTGLALAVIVVSGCGSEQSPELSSWQRVRQALGVPTVSSFTPSSGVPGNRITITGANFTGITTVRFNGTAASQLTVVSDTQLTANVPEGASTGKISVTHPTDGTGTSSADFTVPAPLLPVIDSISPQYGVPGDSITLTGVNLTSATVRFNPSLVATVTSNSDTQVVVTVPAGARTGSISVTTSAGSGSSATPFTLVATAAPTISSFAPTSGRQGNFITVTGTGFNTVTDVDFGGVPAANVTIASDTQLYAYIPAGAVTGPIRVTNPVGQATSSTNVTVLPLVTVSGFSPISAAAGATVSIRGQNFASISSVAFNNKAATSFTVVSPTQINAVVPAGITTGFITVTGPANIDTSPYKLNALSSAPPTLTSFTPSSGGQGTTIALSGTNFTGTKEVTLNGVAGNFTYSSDTAMNFVVPSGASSGRITVINTQGSVTSSTDFTVSPSGGGGGGGGGGGATAPTLSSFSPTHGPNGTVITISGSGFTGATNVQLGSRFVSVTVVDDSTVQVVVPVAANSGPLVVYTPNGSVTSTSSYTVEAAAPPVIRSFSPNNGSSPINIYGAYFTAVTSVKFNGVPAASFTVVGDGRIQASIPTAAFTSGKLTVTNDQGTATSLDDYLVVAKPTITGFTPTSGAPGTTVTVNGSGFSKLTQVTMGRPAVFRILGATQLEVVVPTGIQPSVSIVVSAPSGSAQQGSFSVVPAAAPAVVSFSPDSAIPGTSVNVYGSNFTGATELAFNGAPVGSFTLLNDGWINVSLPSNATTGPVSVKTVAGTGTSAIPFVVPAAPALTAFSPTHGTAGTAITLTGSGFTYAQSVAFKNRGANFYVVSDTQVVAFVPSGALSGPISVSAGSFPTASSASSFTVDASCVPTVSSFAPTSAGANANVNITGSCFTGTTSVQLNGVALTQYTVSSDAAMSVRIPSTGSSGLFSVTNPMGTGSSATSFTFIPPPTINSISPSSGPAGTVVQVLGSDFSTTTQVTLNTLAAPFTVVSDSELSVTIPIGSVTGKLNVSTKGGLRSSAPFTVQSSAAPTITSISPSSGPGGTNVRIDGSGFTGTTRVLFAGEPSYSFTLAGDTVISASVPSDAISGPITVENTLGTATSASSFTVQPPPRILTVSPMSGAAGTAVLLNGYGFTGTTTVSLGGRSAPFSVVSDTQISLTVPSGARSGGIYIIAPAGYASFNSSFTVLSSAIPTISSFNPISGVVGTLVTVTGSGFTGVTEVDFNGIKGSSINAFSDTQLQVYVPSGATTGPLTVINGVGAAVSATRFTVNAVQRPVISSFSPLSAPPGATVTLTGTGFTGTTRVGFRGINAPSFTEVSDTQVTAVVPLAASSGKLSISSASGGAESAADFVVQATDPPTIAGFSPASGASGAQVTVVGTHFTGTTAVTFNGVPAEQWYLSSDQELVTFVPLGATTGPIQVQNTAGQVTSASSYTVIASPVITSISPTSGAIGTTVTLTGSGFSGVTGVVLNGQRVPFTVVSDTQVTWTVPANASSGAVYVLASNGGAVAPSRFTVLSAAAPVLSSFSPTAGPQGTAVILIGANLVGTTAVRFGGVPSSNVSVISDTQIVARVPATAVSGVIQVTTNQGSANSASPFSVDQKAVFTGFSPTSGGPGTTVTLTGSGLAGTTAVVFSGGPATFTVDSDGQLTATAPAGVVTGPITVYGPAGAVTSSASFSVASSAAPTLSGFGPQRLGVGGTVTITGSQFAGLTEVRVNGRLVESFQVISDGVVRAVLPPSASSGLVSVTNPFGTAVSSTALQIIPAPTITSFSPSSGAVGTVVTVSGSGFTNADTVSIGVSFGAVSASFSVVNDSQLRLTVPNGARPGPIAISSPGGSAISSTTFNVLGTVAPSVIGLQPDHGGEGTLVLISGAGFNGVTSVKFNGVDSTFIAAVSSPNYVYATVPAGATTGKVTVTNSVGSGVSASNFTVGPSEMPTLTSVSPTHAVAGAVVTLRGTNLTPLASVAFTNGSDPEIVSSTSTQLQVKVPSSASTGLIAVSNGAGSAVIAFTVDAAPRIVSISPSSAPVNSGPGAVTLTGSNFESGATVKFGGVNAPSVTWVSSSQLNVQYPVSATAGPVDVVVANPSGTQGVLREGFQYQGAGPAPTLSSVTPNHGTTLGGTGVTVTGTNFSPPVSVTFNGVPATSVLRVNSTTLSCTTPAGSAGAATVRVTNGDGQQVQASSLYTYLAPPVVTAISPSSGLTTGGTSVTLSGSGFRAGLTVMIGGLPATSVSVVSDAQITAVTPAHAAGAVDVIVKNDDDQTGTLSGQFTYVAPPPPTVSSIAPTHGFALGGTPVAITGTNFASGAEVKIGGVAASSITVVSSTEINAFTGAHPPGTVNVDVINPDGQAATLTNAFTYDPNPPPTITGISPNHGATAGNTFVTITGTNFRSGLTVTFGGADATVSTVNATSITVRTPARGTIGAVDVVVKNADLQTATATGGYTYDYGAAPSISSLTPSSGSVLGGYTTTLRGSGFVSGVTVTFGGVPATSVTYNSSSRLTVGVPAHAAGAVTVVVTNADGQSASMTNGFTYNPAPAPTLTSVSPVSGPSTGGTTVSLSGTNFASGATVTFGGTAGSSVTFNSATSLTAVTPAHASGAVDVTVTNADGQSATLASAFTFVSASAPTVTSVTPSSGTTNGGDSVTINGTNFANGATVTFGGASATSVTFGSSTSLTAITPAHAAGAVTVVVTNPDTQQASLASAFTYVAPPAPSISSINPTSGPSTGGTFVTLNGSNFVNGCTVKFGTVAATSVSFGSSTSLTAVSPGHSAGLVAITVTNPDSQSGSLPSAFTYLAAPAVTLSSVTPSSGGTNGRTNLTLNGTGFAAGATVTLGGTPATSVVVASSSSISALSPPHGSGNADVVVTNSDGSSATLTNGFTYVLDPAPTLSQLTPNQGAAGQQVTLTGSSFVNGASVTFGTAAATVTYVSATELSASAPSGPSGTVAVTVTNPDGQRSALSSGFTYTQPGGDGGEDPHPTPETPTGCAGGCSSASGLNPLVLLAVGAAILRRRLRRTAPLS